VTLICWMALFAGAVISGTAFVGLLVLKRPAEPLMALLFLTGAVSCSWGIFEISSVSDRVEVLVLSSLLAVASFIGGYGLGAAMLPSLNRKKQPILKIPAAAEGSRGKVAVVLLADVDTLEYEPASVAGDQTLLSSVSGIWLGITPFFYAAQKAKYRAAGGTGLSMLQAKDLVDRVESTLPAEIGITKAAITAGTDELSLDATVASLANEGCNRIIVANVSIGESYATDRAKVLVDQLRLPSHGIEIVYTAPFWSSERLSLMIADRIRVSTDDLSSTGVALVMNGQPEHHRITHPAFDVQETAFCSRIRSNLIEHGANEQLVRSCSLEWRNPDLTETLRHLVAFQCKQILVVPACMPFETLSSRLEIFVAIRSARVDEVTEIRLLGNWGTEAATPSIIAETISELLVDVQQRRPG